MATPKMRTIRRAMKAVGGTAALAKLLGVQEQDVEAWLSGHGVPDNDLYIRALDIVAQGRFARAKGEGDD